MTDAPAHCFHRDFAPGPRRVLRFDLDYLLYAMEGAIRIGVDGRRWSLPPSFAAWIPAETDIAVEVTRPMTSCSVLLRPGFARGLPTCTVVFPLSPLARAMIRHSRRWGPGAAHAPEAAPFFRALLDHCAELAALPADLWQPEGRSDPVRRALAFTGDNLAEPLQLADAARAARLSERTLARHMAEEVGMSWAQALRRLRMIRAAELLMETDRQVLQIAGDVGYGSLSAFNKAFRDFAGCAPVAFRRLRGMERGGG